MVPAYLWCSWLVPSDARGHQLRSPAGWLQLDMISDGKWLGAQHGAPMTLELKQK